MRQNTVKMTTAQFAELHLPKGGKRLPLLRRITEHCF